MSNQQNDIYYESKMEMDQETYKRLTATEKQMRELIKDLMADGLTAKEAIRFAVSR